MHVVHAIHPGDRQLDEARALFVRYGDFLRGLPRPPESFDFDRFTEETRSLPAPYTERNGELLIVEMDAYPVACIAYRATLEDPQTCELKRLYVLPGFRGQGLSRLLVHAVLDRASLRGYTRAILDTDPRQMPEALALYQALGFTEYTREEPYVFLERSLERMPIP